MVSATLRTLQRQTNKAPSKVEYGGSLACNLGVSADHSHDLESHMYPIRLVIRSPTPLPSWVISNQGDVRPRLASSNA